MQGTYSLSKAPLFTVTRAALVLAMALLLGSVLAETVDAKRIPTNVPISKRVQAQKDYCQIDGGSFSVTKTPFGATITNCTGGGGGLGKCVNMEKFTDCSKPLTRPPDGPYGPAPSTGTNAGGINSGGGGPVLGTYNPIGLVASPDSTGDEQDQEAKDPGSETKKKAKGKGKKKGGKRKK